MRGRPLLMGLLAGVMLVAGIVANPTAPPRDMAAASEIGQQALAPSNGSLRFSAAGDFGKNPAAAGVLDLVPGEGDIHLALGDLSYDQASESQWCAFVTSHVGAEYPFQLVSGNHESNGRDGRIGRFVECLPNQLPGVHGRYGRQWYVDVPADDPVARIVMISPGLTFERSTWRYAKGGPRYRWTARAIDEARAAGIDWIVVGMHMPCLSIGRYGCGAGSDIMNLLVRKRVDLVMTGHEHLYQRSKQIATGPGCRRVPTGRFDRDCVASGSSSLRKGAGTVFVTVGTGGTSLRNVRLKDRHRRYFAAWSGRNVLPTHGLLAVEVDGDRLSATFVGSGPGRFADSFTIGS